MKLVGRVAFDEGGHTLADPAQCKRQAQKYVRFAQKARSAHEAILCKFDELAVDDKQSRLR
jgi:hypothetical protein